MKGSDTIKVYHNLKESIFKFDTGKIIFYFSSENNLFKFKDKIIWHRNWMQESLSNRFNLNIANDNLSDIVLYRKIEKRGFLIITERGEIIEWPNQIRLDGDKLTRSEFPELRSVSMQK